MVPAVGESCIAVKTDWLQSLPCGAIHDFGVAKLVDDFFRYGVVKVGRNELVHHLRGEGHFSIEGAPRVGE